jgi:hypothetical protein
VVSGPVKDSSDRGFSRRYAGLAASRGNRATMLGQGGRPGTEESIPVNCIFEIETASDLRITRGFRGHLWFPLDPYQGKTDGLQAGQVVGHDVVDFWQ